MALNNATLMGRLCGDPELRRTTTGKAVVSFTLACDKPGKDSGASFIPCVAWEKTAEFINNFFLKGSPIAVEGRVESRQYETKDNQKRTVVELVVTQAHFCGKKEESVPADVGRPTAAPTQNFAYMTDNDTELPF